MNIVIEKKEDTDTDKDRTDGMINRQEGKEGGKETYTHISNQTD